MDEKLEEYKNHRAVMAQLRLEEYKNYQAVMSLLEKLDKQLAEANAKLEAVKNALPNMRALSGWGSGPRTFVDKIQRIIDS